MSRSIHTTRRTLRELRKQDFADSDEKAAELQKARQQLRRKYFLKRQVETERAVDEMPVAGIDVETIPIEVQDTAPFVHHACSIADIRAVLAALPAAAVDGISRIQLGLGKEYIDESRCDEEDDADPFTGRRSGEVYPGVYAGMVLGVYSSGSALIRLHAFVFDPEHLPLPLEINDFYLRLHVLATLVHEVAHHHDNTQRVRRGRWLADRTENNEWYAEKMEYAWVREVVLPYLERTYPAQVKLLLDWVERFGGLRLPLEFFVGDPRTTTRDGLTRLSCDGRTAFEGWVEELPKCADITYSWLAFAWELHYADEYDFCLQVLEKILAEDPSHTRARECQADTLVHLERWDEGLAITLKLLEENAANSNALWTLADIHEARKEWPQLLAVCDRWKKADETNHLTHLYRAVAFCALGKDSEMEEELRRFGSLRFRHLPETAQRKRLDARRQGIFRRAGRPSKEHVGSQTSHSQGPPT